MRPWNRLIPPLRPGMDARFTLSLALSGPVYAAVEFAGVIARKSLDASAFQITLMMMLMPLANFTAIWWSRILEGRDQRRIMLVSGLIGHIAFITGLWLHSMVHLILILIFYYFTFAINMTGQNRVLQQHVDSNRHGGLFGLSNGLRMGLAAVVSYLAGRWMDQVGGGFRQIYVVAGLLGVVATIIFATMPTAADPSRKTASLSREALWKPLVQAGHLLKRRPDFLRFELGFMAYGIAFMMMLPVVPIFLVDVLKLDYTLIGLARGTVIQFVMIPSMALMGHIFDRMTPHGMGARVFGLLALHPLLLILAAQLPPPYRMMAVYAAFGVFGFAIGGVSVLWSVATNRFAGDEDAGVYQAVHLAATGVRGSFAPLLAFVVMKLFGTTPAMLVASGFWVLASLIMLRLDRTDGRAFLPKPRTPLQAKRA